MRVCLGVVFVVEIRNRLASCVRLEVSETKPPRTAPQTTTSNQTGKRGGGGVVAENRRTRLRSSVDKTHTHVWVEWMEGGGIKYARICSGMWSVAFIYFIFI